MEILSHPVSPVPHQNETESLHGGQIEDSENASATSSSHGPASQPRQKRQKGGMETSEDNTSSRKGRGSSTRKAGKLRCLPDMPLDILFEVFSNLRPLDLLYLARTTKALRGVLMRRSARGIWKDALASVTGLPECPPDLTEPQYVFLAFDTICSFCPSRRVQMVYWALRVRCCGNCKGKRLAKLGEVCGLLRSFMPWDLGLTYLPSQEIEEKKRHLPHRMAYYRRDSAIEFGKELEAIPKADRLDAFLAGKSASKASIEKHAARCEAWHTQQIRDRAQNLEAARERRTEAIRRKLEEAGWAETLESMNYWEYLEFRDHRLVSQSKDLTERIWLNIKDALINYLEQFKTAQLERQRRTEIGRRKTIVERLRTRFCEDHPRIAVPHATELVRMEEFNSIIHLPTDVEVTEDTFAEVMDRLPELCAQWKDAAEKTLVALLPPVEGDEAKSDAERLSLVTSVFRCKRCHIHNFQSFSEALQHHCLISFLLCLPQDLTLSAEVPWRGVDIYHFSRQMRDRVCDIVKLCGKDPGLTTWSEMDDLGQKFDCTCSRHDGPITWRTAVRHSSALVGNCGGKIKLRR